MVPDLLFTPDIILPKYFTKYNRILYFELEYLGTEIKLSQSKYIIFYNQHYDTVLNFNRTYYFHDGRCAVLRTAQSYRPLPYGF